MGIKVKYLDFFFKSIHLDGIRPPYKDVTMCELGNQRMKYDDTQLDHYVREKTGLYGQQLPRSGKEFFTQLGFIHTSIDINGKDGALALDLCAPLPGKMKGQFTIVTNFGTTEHVDDQTVVFSNIAMLLEKNGVVVHVVPAKDGLLKNHGMYQYATDFFAFQVGRYGYEYILAPLERKEVPGCITVSMRKL